MLYINDLPILATPLEVLQELKAQLHANGIERFAEIKVGPSNIQFSCPIHKDGQERKPSCGVLTDNPKNPKETGLVHCFTCGYSATLPEMISHCFGYEDVGNFGREWLVKNFLTISVEDRKDLALNFARKLGQEASEYKYISDYELNAYRYTHSYMYKRKLTDEVIEKFDVGFDKGFMLKDVHIPCITFPVRDQQGRTLFFVRRAIHQKLFHYPEDVTKPVYGLYELPKDTKEVYICESAINALTCYVYGKPAFALLGTGTEYQYEQLRRLPVRSFVLAFDPDNAGRKANEKFRKALKSCKIITEVELPAGKDINDLSYEEFKNLKRFF